MTDCFVCGCQPWAEEGTALLEKAAGQGHAYAMKVLGDIHDERKEHERAVEWYTQGAEAGLPGSMYNLGCCLDLGEGVAAPDCPAAADWYLRAAVAGMGDAAQNLCRMYTVGRGRVSQIMPTSSSSAIQTLVPRIRRYHMTWRAMTARSWGAVSRVARGKR
jgi:TPR repeat protein